MTSGDGSEGHVASLLSWLASRSRPGAPTAPPTELGRELLGQLINAAEGERLTGPLVSAVEDGVLSLPAELAEVLWDRHTEAIKWCLHLEHRLLEVRRQFEFGGGIQHLVLKGPAIAHLDEVDPAVRTFADLDILVASGDIDRAVSILEADGCQRPWPERRPGYDRRFAKSVTLTYPDGVEIDVHRSICDGVHGFRVPPERLFAVPDHFLLGGERVPALSLVHRVLHAAYHAVLGSSRPHLMSLRDLGGYLTRRDVDHREVVAEAQRWRGVSVLAAAVDAMLEALTVEAPEWSCWLDALELSDHERKLVQRQRQEGSALGPGKLDALRELPRLQDKVSFGRALLWPRPAHLRARGLTRKKMFASGYWALKEAQ